MPNCYYQSFVDFIKKNNNLFNGVVYEQAGFYLLRIKNKKGTREMFNKKGVDEGINDIYIDKEHVNKTYKYLEKLSDYIDLVWFGSRVEPHITEKMILRKGCGYDFKFRPKQKELFLELDSYIDSLVSNNGAFRFVSQNKVFHYNFPEDFMSCDVIYWADGDHLSSLGG